LIEGIGKSTFTDFLKEFVLGKGLCVTSTPAPLRTDNNKILCGKLLVVFEELPTFTEGEWSAVSGVLKHLISASTAVYTDKWEKSIELNNINNYVINTNVDAIKCSEGRRYYIAECSTKRKGDYKYFEELREKCFNDEAGEAFFSYVCSIDTDGWNAEKAMPVTQSKLDAIADRLHPVYQFMKAKYVLQRRDLKCALTDLYEEYQIWCPSTHKALSKIKFNEKLKEVGMEMYKSDGKFKYKLTDAELQVIAKRWNWVHELDEYEVPEAVPEPEKLVTVPEMFEVEDPQEFLSPEEDANGQLTVKKIKGNRTRHGTKGKPFTPTVTEENNHHEVIDANIEADAEYIMSVTD
jgi:hypothetical protein